MFSAKDRWTQGEVAVRGGHEWRSYKGFREYWVVGEQANGIGKCPFCWGRENLEGVMTGKNEKGRKTNRETVVFWKERMWCPDRLNYMSKSWSEYGVQGCKSSSQCPCTSTPCPENRIATDVRVKLFPPKPQERGLFKDPSGKTCPQKYVLSLRICDPPRFNHKRGRKVLSRFN